MQFKGNFWYFSTRAKLRQIRFYFFVIFTVTIFSNAAYRDGGYTIPAFRVSTQKVTISRTDVIRGEYDDRLVEIDSLPDIKPGQVILRRKVGSKFSFFKGLLDTTAFGKSPVLYTFPIPSWAKLADFINYRLYQEPTDHSGNDIEDVYFDAERIYVKHFPKLFYYRNSSWFNINGSTLSLGGIEIYTDPPGAQVIIDGVKSGLQTPCTINRMIPGVYTFELVLPGYHTFQKTVRVYPENTITAAFEMLSDMDTIYISGKAPYSVLILPQPPTDSLFVIDGAKVYSLKTRLKPGSHHLYWNGGTMYESIDTVLSVAEGSVTYFDYVFKRRFGVLRVTASPGDAELCIQGIPCKIGEQVLELPTGIYSVSAFHIGFRSLKKTVAVFPDTLVMCEMDLTQMPDRDADGFIDSVDACPDKYGLYGGCPRMKAGEALKVKKDEVFDYVKEDPFAFGVSFLGGITRVPTKKRFADFIGNFSGVRIGGVNNYRGMTIMNNYHLQFRGLYTGLELGQWAAGLKYERNDTLIIETKDKKYLIYYDSIFEVEPVMYIPSTSFYAGFHYSLKWLNVIYSIGYQWENIVLDQVYNATDNLFEKIVMDNDWWFHQLAIEANFNRDGFIVPSVYMRAKLPFGKANITRWVAMQSGIQVKLIPAHWKRSKGL